MVLVHHGSSQWFQVLWPPHLVLTMPTLRDLYPIALACGMWDQHWSGRLVLCQSDNIAAVLHVNHLHARYALACHMLKCLAFSRLSMSAACTLSISLHQTTVSQICFLTTMLLHSCTTPVMLTLPLKSHSTSPTSYALCTTLDVATVEGDVQQVLEVGHASSTRKTNAAGWKCYQFCTSAFCLSVFPIIDRKVTLFIAFFGTEGLTASIMET